eukprot:3328805-Rhodomonas_salina.1
MATCPASCSVIVRCKCMVDFLVSSAMLFRRRERMSWATADNAAGAVAVSGNVCSRSQMQHANRDLPQSSDDRGGKSLNAIR